MGWTFYDSSGKTLQSLGTISNDDWSGTDLAVANGGTGASTLTDGGILLGSGTSAVTAMAVLADGAIVIGDGTTDPVPLSAFSSSTGALKVANGGTGQANLTSLTLVTPALGTPSALVGTNISGTASSLTAGAVTTNANLTGHVTSSGNAAVLGSFSSAQLKTALSDETGSGAAVFATSPTLVTPVLGTPASGNLTNCTGAGVGLGLVIALS